MARTHYQPWAVVDGQMAELNANLDQLGEVANDFKNEIAWLNQPLKDRTLVSQQMPRTILVEGDSLFGQRKEVNHAKQL